MKSALIFILCALTVRIDLVYSALIDNETDTQCKDDYKKMEQCYFDKLGEQVEEKATEYKNGVAKCFKARSGCDTPDFDHNPMSEMPRFIRKIAEKVKDEWANTSHVVKQCIRRNFTETAAILLNNCINERGVQQFNVTQFVELFASEGGSDIFGQMLSDPGNQTATQNWKTMLLGNLNIARSFRECDEKQGDNTTRIGKQTLGRCTKIVFANAKAHFCNETAKCRNDVPPNCNQRAERVYQAVCDCKYQKILEMVQRLDDLRKRGNITLPEMINIMSVGEDPRKYLHAIEDCYVKNKEKTPSIIRFVDELSRSFSSNKTVSTTSKNIKISNTNTTTDDKTKSNMDTGKYTGEPDPMFTHASTQASVVDDSIILVIRDFLASQAFNQEECIPCNK